MSLKPLPSPPVPAETARVAQAAFPHGTPYLTLRDHLGTIFQDEQFTDLYPRKGHPGFPPWRLALVTLMQFRENLADRQAAEAVRARIDWKYLLGLELTDSGFDFSVLSEFRVRLLHGSAEERLLNTLLAQCQAQGLLTARGQQRTDSTHVLAAIRTLNRLELVAETLRAALNVLAVAAPAWLQHLAPLAWYERYSKRIEDSRLPREPAKRAAYAQTVGEDGFRLLDALDAEEGLAELRALPSITTLRRTWERHYERSAPEATPAGTPRRVRLKDKRKLPPAADGIESPYDIEARYRHKRDTQWTGYMVHVSETCEETTPHLLTHVHTTSAAVHEALCTAPITQALVEKALPPREHFVDAAYVSAELLLTNRDTHAITLRGPTRQNVSWQTQIDEGYTLEHFTIAWEHQQVTCPQGKQAVTWTPQVNRKLNRPGIIVTFRREDCQACPARAQCTRATQSGRRLHFPPQAQYEALHEARAWYASEEGRQQYARRAGIEGTLSQDVRGFGLRRTRYRGLAKTHLHHVGIASAINIDRLVAWFEGHPRATTRTSHLAALAPEIAPGPG